MTHLTRRPPRVKPPLRGRAAAFSTPEQRQQLPMPVFRRRPPSSGPVREKGGYRPRPEAVHPVLIKLYKLWPYLFNVLDRPWKWLLALVALIILSIIIGSLL